MKIDITGSDLQAFLSLAQKFPNGKITCETKKAYWEWDGQIQQIPQQPMAPVGYAQPMSPQQQPQQKNAFLRMFDAMGDYF